MSSDLIPEALAKLYALKQEVYERAMVPEQKATYQEELERQKKMAMLHSGLSTGFAMTTIGSTPTSTTMSTGAYYAPGSSSLKKEPKAEYKETEYIQLD